MRLVEALKMALPRFPNIQMPGHVGWYATEFTRLEGPLVMSGLLELVTSGSCTCTSSMPPWKHNLFQDCSMAER